MVCYERAIALTDEAAEPAFAMTLHERLADVAFLSASYSRALTGYEQALRLAHGLGDEVRLRRRIGDTLSKTGRLAQADDILRRAIRRAGRRVVNPGLALPVLFQCDDLPWRLLSRLPRSFGPTTVEARALAGEVGRAYTSLGLLNLFVCDAKARGFLYRGMNLAARCRDDALLCETLIHRIWTCLTQTDFKGAHANLRDARAAANRTGSRYLLALCSATEVRILVRQGAWTRTAELARHVVTELEDIGELHLRALTSAHLGFALLHLGDTPRARVWCERALALFARGPGTHHEILPAVSGCAEVLAVAGEFDEARKQLQANHRVSRLAGDRDRGCLLSASRGDLRSTGTRAVRRVCPRLGGGREGTRGAGRRSALHALYRRRARDHGRAAAARSRAPAAAQTGSTFAQSPDWLHPRSTRAPWRWDDAVLSGIPRHGDDHPCRT